MSDSFAWLGSLSSNVHAQFRIFNAAGRLRTSGVPASALSGKAVAVPLLSSTSGFESKGVVHLLHGVFHRRSSLGRAAPGAAIFQTKMGCSLYLAFEDRAYTASQSKDIAPHKRASRQSTV
jgi:hypothetical protein